LILRLSSKEFLFEKGKGWLVLGTPHDGLPGPPQKLVYPGPGRSDFATLLNGEIVDLPIDRPGYFYLTLSQLTVQRAYDHRKFRLPRFWATLTLTTEQLEQGTATVDLDVELPRITVVDSDGRAVHQYIRLFEEGDLFLHFAKMYRIDPGDCALLFIDVLGLGRHIPVNRERGDYALLCTPL